MTDDVESILRTMRPVTVGRARGASVDGGRSVSRTTSRHRFPDSEALAAGLASVFRRDGVTRDDVTILDRRPNPFESTFPTEIVACRLDGRRRPLQLFVKYGTNEFDSVYGHRGNVSYEVRVYREVLEPLRTSTPRFHGAYRGARGSAPWLIVEYLPGGVPGSWAKDPIAMVRSAEWIGRFHAANEGRVRSPRLKFLRRYDSEYYRGWARRTRRLFRRLHSKFPWLAPLCGEFERRVPTLLKAPQTVIHGEYFGSNVVYRHGMSHPVDWQSAAIAAGEVDLASLTHSWSRDVVQRCERAYVRGRWPDGEPDGFRETLGVARIYMSLRWLGDPTYMSSLVTRQGRPVAPRNVYVAMQAAIHLHSLGERLGLV